MTLDIGFISPFLAWCSVSMVDSLVDFDRDNAYATDIFTVDETRTTSRVTGGDHWGPPGSDDNVFEPALVGTGQRVNCWLRGVHADDLDTFGYACLLVTE
ncbi:hypothetical protein C1701_24580 [Actinoalloteichus sp. AHMU CJ021]|uniref:Uncharacterized protein n=1 Tax=Actinoalloteichus caeruleus DSM 43889 TaxID=1120930 RepID=A0ABT1JF82_ACTCY|nr:hypothetical protein [Actinoalloteichus caeruleus]AUS80988.1 hypothetical protein C1701_24580 [Actinoalloteichus sp. AHMU CJ021]MCP2330446.1 hypothetical protein [Actinoalloteichus caeruleus DSM 43889]